MKLSVSVGGEHFIRSLSLCFLPRLDGEIQSLILPPLYNKNKDFRVHFGSRVDTLVCIYVSAILIVFCISLHLFQNIYRQDGNLDDTHVIGRNAFPFW